MLQVTFFGTKQKGHMTAKTFDHLGILALAGLDADFELSGANPIILVTEKGTEVRYKDAAQLHSKEQVPAVAALINKVRGRGKFVTLKFESARLANPDGNKPAEEVESDI